MERRRPDADSKDVIHHSTRDESVTPAPIYTGGVSSHRPPAAAIINRSPFLIAAVSYGGVALQRCDELWQQSRSMRRRAFYSLDQSTQFPWRRIALRFKGGQFFAMSTDRGKFLRR